MHGLLELCVGANLTALLEHVGYGVGAPKLLRQELVLVRKKEVGRRDRGGWRGGWGGRGGCGLGE